MKKKAKRRRVGYGPMGTPGAGSGQTHASAVPGSGRLGRAMRSLAKKRAAPPTAVKQPTPGDLTRWANEGGEVGPAVPVSKPRTQSVKAENNTMANKSRTATHIAERSPDESPAVERSRANLTNQVRATTAAKDARKQEAGLAGNRTGKSSASGKRAQGRRDSKHS